MSNTTNPPFETRFQTPQHKDTIYRMPGSLFDPTQFHEEEGYMLLNPAPEFFLPSYMKPKASWGQSLVQTFRRILPYGRHVTLGNESTLDDTVDPLQAECQGHLGFECEQGEERSVNPTVSGDADNQNGFFTSSVTEVYADGSTPITPSAKNASKVYAERTTPNTTSVNGHSEITDEGSALHTSSVNNVSDVNDEGSALFTSSVNNASKFDDDSPNPFVAHVEQILDASIDSMVLIEDGLKAEISKVAVGESLMYNCNSGNLSGVDDMDIDSQHLETPHRSTLAQSPIPAIASTNVSDKETAPSFPDTASFHQPSQEPDIDNPDSPTDAFPKLKDALKSFNLGEDRVELAPIGTCDIQIDGCAFKGARFFKVVRRDMPSSLLPSSPEVKPVVTARKGSPFSVNSQSTAKSARRPGTSAISKYINKTPCNTIPTNSKSARCKMTLRSGRPTMPKVCEETKIETIAGSATISWAPTAYGAPLVEECQSPGCFGNTRKISTVDVEESPSLCRESSASIKLEEGCNHGQPGLSRFYKSLRIAKIFVPGAAKPQYLRTPPTSEPDLLQILQNRKMAAPLPKISLPSSSSGCPRKWPDLAFEVPGQAGDYFIFPLDAATVFTTGYNPHHMVLAYMLQPSPSIKSRGEPILLRLSCVSDNLWVALCDATQDTTIACSGMLGLKPESQHPLNHLAYAAACAAYATPDSSWVSCCPEPYTGQMDLHDDSEATETESWRGRPNDDSTATSRCNTPIRTEFSAASSTPGSPSRRDTVSAIAALASMAVAPVSAGSAGAKGVKQRGHSVRGGGNGSGRYHPYVPNEVLWCRNCGTSRTPLWRSGPQGPKTLCNACGVKWKAGKLDGADFSKSIAASSNSPETKRRGGRSATGKSSSSASSPGQDPVVAPAAARSAGLPVGSRQKDSTPVDSGRYQLRSRSRSATEERSVSVAPAPPPSTNGRKRKLGRGDEGRKRSKN